MALRRRKYLQLFPILSIAGISGCSRQDKSFSVTLRMVRVINLAETEVPIRVTVSQNTETPETLYSGLIGTQGPDAEDGEVVVQPSKLTEPLQYDYYLTIAGSQQATVRSDSLTSAYRTESAEHPVGCLELSFTIRNPVREVENGSDYTFWESCQTAPGTVDPHNPT